STEVRLTRAELEAMVRPALSDSIEALKRAIRSAGVEAADLDAVLLVGGSSRMPIVSQLVVAELGRPVAADAHPKHAVALGAAFVASAAPAAASGAVTGPPSRPTPAVRRDPFDDPARRGFPGRPTPPSRLGPPSGPVPAVGHPSGPVPAAGPLAGPGGRPGPDRARFDQPADRPGFDRPANRPGPDRRDPAERPGFGPAPVRPGPTDRPAFRPGPGPGPTDRPGAPGQAGSGPVDRPGSRPGPGGPGPTDRLDVPGQRPGQASGLPPGPRTAPPGARPPVARPAVGLPLAGAAPGERRPGGGQPPAGAPPLSRAPGGGAPGGGVSGSGAPGGAAPRRPADDYFPGNRPAPADATEIFARVPAGGAPPTFQPPRPSPPAGRGGRGGGGRAGGRRLVPVVIAFLLAAAVAAAAGVLYAKHDRAQNRAAGNQPAGTDAARTNNTPSDQPSPTTPSDEQCTDQIKASKRWVCLTKATFDGNRIVIEYQANFAGDTPHAAGGYHLHIYGGNGTVPDENTEGSQSPTPGRWYVEDQNPSIRKASGNDFNKAIGADATLVCARVANPQHELTHDPNGGHHTGNCIPIHRI
ncbi:MAG: hypothetical protein V7637_629, partial [Mycobacteriales bacterium]